MYREIKPTESVKLFPLKLFTVYSSLLWLVHDDIDTNRYGMYRYVGDNRPHNSVISTA